MAGHGDNKKKDDCCVPGEEIARGLILFWPRVLLPHGVLRVPVSRCFARCLLSLATRRIFASRRPATHVGFMHLTRRSTAKLRRESPRSLQWRELFTTEGFNRCYADGRLRIAVMELSLKWMKISVMMIDCEGRFC